MVSHKKCSMNQLCLWNWTFSLQEMLFLSVPQEWLFLLIRFLKVTCRFVYKIIFLKENKSINFFSPSSFFQVRYILALPSLIWLVTLPSSLLLLNLLSLGILTILLSLILVMWLFHSFLRCFIHRSTTSTSNISLILTFLFLFISKYLVIFLKIFISALLRILFVWVLSLLFFANISE